MICFYFFNFIKRSIKPIITRVDLVNWFLRDRWTMKLFYFHPLDFSFSFYYGRRNPVCDPTFLLQVFFLFTSKAFLTFSQLPSQWDKTCMRIWDNSNVHYVIVWEFVWKLWKPLGALISPKSKPRPDRHTSRSVECLPGELSFLKCSTSKLDSMLERKRILF